MLPDLIYTDRYRNKGTRTYSKHADYSEALPQYQPGSPVENFCLPCHWLPGEKVHLYLANPGQDLLDIYVKKDEIMFCVHPQVAKQFADDPYVRILQEQGRVARGLTAVPSSSTRTLYIFQENRLHHAVKVHLPVRISRYGRKMRNEVIEQAIRVSREMESGIGQMDSSFAFLREVIGISHKSISPDCESRGENWGFLVRDMKPFPEKKSANTLIPGFALFGKDQFDPEISPILFDLIKDADPVSYILEQIMLPVISHWIDCFLGFGFMLEPHGQNILLEVDDQGTIQRIVHRDLSVGTDMRLRRDKKLSHENFPSYNQMETPEFLSITYDMFMGNHFFARLVSCCQEKFSHVRYEDFTEPCKKHFAARFPQHKTYFPDRVFYFSEQRDLYGKPLYKNTGQLPVWRP